MSEADEEWLNRKDVSGRRKLISGDTQEIVEGVTAIRVGGHFEGSLVLHWKEADAVFHADSFMVVPVCFISHILSHCSTVIVPL